LRKNKEKVKSNTSRS